MAAVELAGTLGERYLIEHRKLPPGGPWQATLAGGFTVRFATGGMLPEKSGKQRPLGPTIIARITMPNGKVCGYQVLLLDADGRKSGSFIVGKVPPGVADIRLRSNVTKDGPLPVLVLAEGLETGLSRLVPGLPGPVVLEVTCGALPTAVEKRVAGMAKLLLQQGTGSPDYTRMWSRIELLVDRDQIPNTVIAAQTLNAATGIAVARLTAPPEVAGRNADLNDVLQALGPTGVFEAWLDGLLGELPQGACLMAPKGQESDLSTGLIERTWRNAAGRTRVSVDRNWYAWSAAARRRRSEDDVEVLNDVQNILDRSFEVGERSGAKRWSSTTVDLRDRVTKMARDQVTEPAIRTLSGACYWLGSRSGATEMPDTILLQGGLVMDLRTRVVRTVDQNVFGLSVIAADPKRLTRGAAYFRTRAARGIRTVGRVHRCGCRGTDCAHLRTDRARTDRRSAEPAEAVPAAGSHRHRQERGDQHDGSATGRGVRVDVIGRSRRTVWPGAIGRCRGYPDVRHPRRRTPQPGPQGGARPVETPENNRQRHRVGRGQVQTGLRRAALTMRDRRRQCSAERPDGSRRRLGAPAGNDRLCRTINQAVSRPDPRDHDHRQRTVRYPGTILGRRRPAAGTPGVHHVARDYPVPESCHGTGRAAARTGRVHTESAPGSYLTRGESYAAYLCMAADNGMRWPLSPRSFHPAFRHALEAIDRSVVEIGRAHV
jgi:hypothetical protein